jgi:hypothetical protein
MTLFSIPTPHLGWGFFSAAEPSILSTTRPSSRRHQQSRTGRARTSHMAPMSLRALIVGDPYAQGFHCDEEALGFS